MLEDVLRDGDPALTVRVEPRRDVVIVHAAGELDIATTDQLHVALAELWLAGFTIVRINLFELEFMDCTGLGMLEREQRAAADRGCRLEVLVGGGIVGRLIDLVGRDRLSVTRPPPVDPLSQARHG